MTNHCLSSTNNCCNNSIDTPIDKIMPTEKTNILKCPIDKQFRVYVSYLKPLIK